MEKTDRRELLRTNLLQLRILLRAVDTPAAKEGLFDSQLLLDKLHRYPDEDIRRVSVNQPTWEQAHAAIRKDGGESIHEYVKAMQTYLDNPTWVTWELVSLCCIIIQYHQ